MKTFFDGIYIDGSQIDEENEYPIKLEYYKITELKENVKANYGIEIVKSEFIQGKVNIENSKVENITSDNDEIEKILNMLKNNKVTPIGIQDALEEILIYD